MVYFRSQSGKHIVTHNGQEHVFGTFSEAWNFIKKIKEN